MKLNSLSPLTPKPTARRLKKNRPADCLDTVSLSRSGGSAGWRKAGLAAAAACSLGGLMASPASAASSTATVRVLTLNTWLDCKDGVDGIAEVLKASRADVVGLQEIGSCAEKLSDKLGYNLVKQDDWHAMLTRLPVESVTPGRHGMVVRLENGQPLAVFNAHLYHSPYQPYQLLGIPYGDGVFVKTEAEAQEQARLARGHDVTSILSDMAGVQAPMILTGDFNEPSHLDWTQRAAEAGRHPIKVEWPASKSFAEAGFKDSYRVVNPDELTHPGFTWTPRTADDDPKDHHDRLDFVLFKGDQIQPQAVEIVGESSPRSDIVVTPYPTDHRGVVAEFEVKP
ncbi:endonuclease/exonuclease/phosphatase family protein [bacterium]|nr:endonuclease/exonuclease/phosphatase family protein [bacterium]